uniref:Ig-like domain-containing protein n=1 Tax=Salmo trutta TaxID=8032 RepID=A0A674F486_SALTR
MDFKTIEPNQQEVYAEVGSNVLLSCNYSSADSLLWYKQSPGSAPQYLLLILDSTGTEHRDNSLDPRFSGKLNKEKTRVDLEISSAKVTDSALYYCALTPTVTGNPETLAAKMRKMDSECRVFKEWTAKYFFFKAVCLICQESFAVFKEYNRNCHFSSKHAKRVSACLEKMNLPWSKHHNRWITKSNR